MHLRIPQSFQKLEMQNTHCFQHLNENNFVSLSISFGQKRFLFKTRQSIQWTPGYNIHWKLMKTILIVTKNSLIRT